MPCLAEAASLCERAMYRKLLILLYELIKPTFSIAEAVAAHRGGASGGLPDLPRRPRRSGYPELLEPKLCRHRGADRHSAERRRVLLPKA